MEWSQRLVEDDPTQGSACHRRRQAQERWRRGRQPPDTPKPKYEGQGGTDQAQVSKPGEVGCGHRAWHAFDRGGEGEDEDAAQEELPARGRQSIFGDRKTLGEHDPSGKRNVGGDGREDSDSVEAGAGADHDQTDPQCCHDSYR